MKSKNLLLILMVCLAVNIRGISAMVFPAGCMDPTAINYNPEATQDDGSCIYDTDQLGLSIVGGNEVCAGTEISFVITGVASLSAGTDLVVHFSDGSSALTFALDALPDLNTFTHIFPVTSCGSTSLTGIANAFSVAITAYDLFDVEYAWDSVDPVFVSGPSQFAQSGLFQSPPSGPYCVGQYLSFVNYSLGYYLVDANGCSQNYTVSFFTDANQVFVEQENTAVFPEFIALSFLEQGTFEVGVSLESGCFYQSASVTVEVGPVVGSVSLWTFDENTLVPVPDMRVNLYTYGLQPQEFNSFETFSDLEGQVVFDEVPQGIYLARATPDLSIPDQSNFISTFTNEKVQWSAANLIVVGCATHYQDTIYVKNQAGPDAFGGAAAGRLVVRDPAPGLPIDGGQPEVRNFVEGDPIPGVPIIIMRDTAQGGVPVFNPFGMQLSADDPIITEQGYFNFTDLPSGYYRIHVDMPGLPMAQTYFFTVDLNSVIWEELNFYADLTDAIYTSDPVSIDEIGQDLDGKLFPNPFHDRFSVEFDRNVYPKTLKWTLTEISGKSVRPAWATLSSRHLIVDASNLPPGFYVLSVSDDTFRTDFKVVKF